MFKHFKIIITILSSLMVLSCQKEISIEPGNATAGNNTNGSLRMKINGSQWNADKGATASILAGFISISGVSSDNKSLDITLNDTVPGTYVLDQKSFHAAALSDSSDLAGLSFTTYEGRDTSEAGGIVMISSIDKLNKTISGTFRFKAFRDFDGKQKIITEGAFNKLPYVVTLPLASITDTFNVNIDNVLWTAKSIAGIISGTALSVSGSEPDLTKVVGLSIPYTINPGTYDLDALAGIYIGLYIPTTTSFLTSQSGKLTIVEHNRITKRIGGNFNFKAVDQATNKSAQLTAGYFSMVYQ